MQTNAVPDLTLTIEPPPTRELTDQQFTADQFNDQQFNELFENFFNPDLGELALCKQHGLTLDRLYEIFTSERFQRALQRLEAIRQLRAQHQASLIQRDALAGLHNLTHARAPNATSAEASRKACMALLKLIPTQPVSQDPPPLPTGEVAPKVTEGDSHASSGRAATVRERSTSSRSSPVSQWGGGGGGTRSVAEGFLVELTSAPSGSQGSPPPPLGTGEDLGHDGLVARPTGKAQRKLWMRSSSTHRPKWSKECHSQRSVRPPPSTCLTATG